MSERTDDEQVRTTVGSRRYMSQARCCSSSVLSLILVFSCPHRAVRHVAVLVVTTRWDGSSEGGVGGGGHHGCRWRVIVITSLYVKVFISIVK